jgi:hypothetical protein
MKTCPQCSEQVNDNAKRCPHCHGDITQRGFWGIVRSGAAKSSVVVGSLLVTALVTSWAGTNTDSTPRSESACLGGAAEAGT